MALSDEAWQGRCLMRAARAATLATQRDGHPFASLVTPTVAPDGAVLMLLSAMAEHTKHLVADPRCSLLFAGPPENLNPQTAPRLSISGRAQVSEDAALRDWWLERHPYAALYAGFSDFSLWQVLPDRALMVGGFARATWLDTADLAPSAHSAAAVHAEGALIVAHCNGHAREINLLAHAHGGHGEWRMLGVDCDGVDLFQDESVLRIAFDAPVSDAAGVRAALSRLIGATKGWFW